MHRFDTLSQTNMLHNFCHIYFTKITSDVFPRWLYVFILASAKSPNAILLEAILLEASLLEASLFEYFIIDSHIICICLRVFRCNPNQYECWQAQSLLIHFLSLSASGEGGRVSASAGSNPSYYITFNSSRPASSSYMSQNPKNSTTQDKIITKQQKSQNKHKDITKCFLAVARIGRTSPSSTIIEQR